MPAGTKQIKVLFDETWLVGVSHHPLAGGDAPRLRNGSSLACFAGKLLLLVGGEADPPSTASLSASGRWGSAAQPSASAATAL